MWNNVKEVEANKMRKIYKKKDEKEQPKPSPISKNRKYGHVLTIPIRLNTKREHTAHNGCMCNNENASHDMSHHAKYYFFLFLFSEV